MCTEDITKKDKETLRGGGMTLTSVKTQTFFDNGCFVDVVTKEDDYEAWIYFEDYAEKQLMFGMLQEQLSYPEFLQIVAANIDDYKNVVMNKTQKGEAYENE